MGIELNSRSGLLFFLGKLWDSQSSLWQARQHNLVDMRALPHAHQPGLCSWTWGSAAIGAGTHTMGKPHHSAGAIPTRHPAPDPPEHIWLCVTSMSAPFSGGKEKHGWHGHREVWEGWEGSQEQGKYQAIFTKASVYLLLTTVCMSLSTHIYKW